MMTSSAKNQIYGMYKKYKKIVFPYKPLGAFGPEHEFSIIDEELNPLSISDLFIRDYSGSIVDCIYTPKYAFGREAVLHQLEIKTTEPFVSPKSFEETMQAAVSDVLYFLKKKYAARLLGTGMHPTLQLENTSLWLHSCQDIYLEYARIFDLNRHGWRNIQSFQLNLPFFNEKWGVAIYNALAHLCTYLPAISASSPIIEGKLGKNVDNRLSYYRAKTREIPSITGQIVPKTISSFAQLRKQVTDKYSLELAEVGAIEKIKHAEWMDQRSIIFKFSRKAIEVRVMDEQECIKSDVALSCFIRSAIRGLIAIINNPSHDLLVSDYNAVVADGLDAKVLHPNGKTAREVCKYFLKIAFEYATKDEKKYLWIVMRRIDEGNLSDVIRNRVIARSKKTTMKEAILTIYLQLAKALSENNPYF